MPILWIIAGSFALSAPLYLLFITRGCLFRICAFLVALTGAALAGSAMWAAMHAGSVPADLAGVLVAIIAYLAVAEAFVWLGKKGRGEG